MAVAVVEGLNKNQPMDCPPGQRRVAFQRGGRWCRFDCSKKQDASVSGLNKKITYQE